jgi:hypothetical protein
VVIVLGSSGMVVIVLASSGMVVIVLASSAVDCRSAPVRVKPKTLRLLFAACPLRSKSKYWLALAMNQDNVSEWSNMSTHGLLFQ